MNHVEIFEGIVREEGAEYLAAAAVRAKTATPEDARRLLPAMIQFLNYGSAKIAREARRDPSIDAAFPSTSDAALIIAIAESAMMDRALRQKWRDYPEWPLLFTAAPNDGVCAAATKLDGRMYAVADAPKLPLSRCGQAHCRCGFIQKVVF